MNDFVGSMFHDQKMADLHREGDSSRLAASAPKGTRRIPRPRWRAWLSHTASAANPLVWLRRGVAAVATHLF
jgi:hypothetical protein